MSLNPTNSGPSDLVSNTALDDETSSAAHAVEFAQLIGRLKTTPRTGWVRRGVPRYESVADHSWRVATLSLLLWSPQDSNDTTCRTVSNDLSNQTVSSHKTDAPTSTSTSPQLDVAKCMAMALVHDLAECIVGDIAPDDHVPPDEKQRRETTAMTTLAHLLGRASPHSGAHHYVQRLFAEYEERTSHEAVAVKDLDLLDMILQAHEYEERFGMDLSEFFDTTPPSRFRTPSIAAMAQHVHEERRTKLDGTASQSNTPDERCRVERAFAEEYAPASKLDADTITQVLEAYHHWKS